jgi:O-antigen/teichoic acid export membrane protein
MSSHALPDGHLRRNAILASLNVVVGSALLFILYKYLLHRLDATQLGVWSLVVASTNVARLADLGLAGGTTRFVAAALAQGKSERAAAVVETSVIALAAGALVLCALLLPLLQWLLAGLVPASQLDVALAMLPWSAAALGTGLVGAAAASALDGCGRTDLRIYAGLGAQLVLVALSIWLVPVLGIKGVAIAQLAQALVNGITAWLLLRRQLHALPVFPHRCSTSVLRSIASYSALFQLNNIFIMLVDPVAKMLLAKFGGLSATAYFDMAAQLIQRSRQILVTGAQTLVPAAAHANERGGADVRKLYASSYATMMMLALPGFSALVVVVPAVGLAWIGHAEPMFTGIAWICTAGLLLNTVGTPAYFFNLGTGDVALNTQGHAITASVASLGGFLGGQWFGAQGVAVAYAASMALGGLYVQLRFMMRHGVVFASLLPPGSAALLTACALALALVLPLDLRIIAPRIGAADALSQLLRAVTIALLFALLISPALWRHPARKSLLRAAPAAFVTMLLLIGSATPSTTSAANADRIDIPVAAFTHSTGLTPQNIQDIQSSGILRHYGTVDYTFQAPHSGWYSLWMTVADWPTDLLLDGKPLLHATLPAGIWPDRDGMQKVLNVELQQGSHTLRLGHLWHPGLPYVHRIQLRSAQNSTDRVRLTPEHDHAVFRVGESFRISVAAGHPQC